MAEISSNKTIAKNTLLLYMRMALTMLVSLYTSRVILNVLGVVDDGIYSIVGGTVSIFMFLNGTLSTATSRFLTVELAKENREKLKKTFSAALLVHIILAIVIFLLLETVGLWILNEKLVIPEERMYAAKVVYHLSAISSLLSVTQVPYSASIVAHEKMGAFAYMSILEVSFKLLICFLVKVSPIDKLITYGILVLCVQTLIRVIYRVYCIRHFEECHFSMVKDWNLVKPILSFSSWNIISGVSIMARDQGVDVVMNTFFGPTINSAAGKAGVISNAVNGFSQNFLTAIRPPIVKSYSIGNYRKMEELMIDASRYAFSLLLLFSVPFFFESQFIIELWLKNPPKYTALFCISDLVLVLITATFRPLTYALQATGNIRLMSILDGALFLSSLPIAYFLLITDKGPIAPWIAKCIIQFFVAFTNLILVKKNIPEFDIPLFLKSTAFRLLLSILIVIPITYLVYRAFPDNNWLCFLITCTASTLLVCATAFYIIFDKKMRLYIIRQINNLLKKIVAH